MEVAGFSDEEYREAGARVVDGAEEVFEAADLIVKVKEPVPEEYDRFKEGQSYSRTCTSRRIRDSRSS